MTEFHESDARCAWKKKKKEKEKEKERSEGARDLCKIISQ